MIDITFKQVRPRFEFRFYNLISLGWFNPESIEYFALQYFRELRKGIIRVRDLFIHNRLPHSFPVLEFSDINLFRRLFRGLDRAVNTVSKIQDLSDFVGLLFAEALLVEADLGRLGPNQATLPPDRDPNPLDQDVLHQTNRLEFVGQQA